MQSGLDYNLEKQLNEWNTNKKVAFFAAYEKAKGDYREVISVPFPNIDMAIQFVIELHLWVKLCYDSPTGYHIRHIFEPAWLFYTNAKEMQLGMEQEGADMANIQHDGNTMGWGISFFTVNSGDTAIRKPTKHFTRIQNENQWTEKNKEYLGDEGKIKPEPKIKAVGLYGKGSFGISFYNEDHMVKYLVVKKRHTPTGRMKELIECNGLKIN